MSISVNSHDKLIGSMAVLKSGLMEKVMPYFEMDGTGGETEAENVAQQIHKTWKIPVYR